MNEEYLEFKIAQLEARLAKLENKTSPLEYLIWAINGSQPRGTFSLDLGSIVELAQEFEECGDE